MKKYIALIISLFAINNTYSMMRNVSQEEILEHAKISAQAAELIQSNIDKTTIGKWKELIEQAKQFQKAHPQFPYLHLARKPGQGPDAQSIISTAPIVINLLEHKCVEQDKLKKIVYNFGNQYMLKVITASKN